MQHLFHFVKDELWDKGDAKLSVTHDDQLLLKLQSKNNVTDEFNDALVDAIDLLKMTITQVWSFMQMVIISVWVLTFS